MKTQSLGKRTALLALVTSVMLAACSVSLTACKSTSVSKYVQPRVVGRVVDEVTHQPIKGVTVKRLTSNTSQRPMDAPKGGQLMQEPPPVRTGEDGAFVIDPERDLGLFSSSWYSVSLSFRHPDYQPFMAYFTVANSTNIAGVPTVQTGDILLLRSGGPGK
jgi:hypothetical protein